VSLYNVVSVLNVLGWPVAIMWGTHEVSKAAQAFGRAQPKHRRM
jgi:hypothetical protein